jgi:hypothetical protein
MSVNTFTTRVAAPDATRPHPMIVVMLKTPFRWIFTFKLPKNKEVIHMFFTEKTVTVGCIKDFLTENPARKKIITSTALTGLGIGAVSTLFQAPPQAVPVMAMPMPVMGLSVTDKIIHAFDPIVQLMQGLSYPVCFIMLSAGFLVIMTGNKTKGLQIIKWASIGYIGMQFAPAIMAILVEVGKAIVK